MGWFLPRSGGSISGPGRGLPGSGGYRRFWWRRWFGHLWFIGSGDSGPAHYLPRKSQASISPITAPAVPKPSTYFIGQTLTACVASVAVFSIGGFSMWNQPAIAHKGSQTTRPGFGPGVLFCWAAVGLTGNAPAFSVPVKATVNAPSPSIRSASSSSLPPRPVIFGFLAPRRESHQIGVDERATAALRSSGLLSWSSWRRHHSRAAFSGRRAQS